MLARLLTFHNVLITSHQAFLTHEALANIAETTLASVLAFERGKHLANEVRAADVPYERNGPADHAAHLS